MMCNEYLLDRRHRIADRKKQYRCSVARSNPGVDFHRIGPRGCIPTHFTLVFEEFFYVAANSCEHPIGYAVLVLRQSECRESFDCGGLLRPPKFGGSGSEPNRTSTIRKLAQGTIRRRARTGTGDRPIQGSAPPAISDLRRNAQSPNESGVLEIVPIAVADTT